MSRVGKNPVKIPAGVTVEIGGQQVKAKGKLGELVTGFTRDVKVTREGDAVVIVPGAETLEARRLWGSVRNNIKNMVQGVATGYKRDLEISGVGYRAQVQGKDLVLQLGYSHEIRYPIPVGIKISCADQTHVTIEGADKQKVGQVAAEIRGYRPPEPYKGKGIKYAGEHILRKEGKKK